MEKKKVDWPFVESVKEKLLKTLEKVAIYSIHTTIATTINRSNLK